ncbi:MAG: hypothetical protein K8S97_04830 [Anaerolineae bacterium]|nr:hypothetical protein [Anaerolineae bacterium]
MYHLATVFPPIKRLRIPLSRDQVMLLMAAVNEVFLGVDIYLAHKISGTIVPYEWIPIIFGPIAGALLLVAGLIALRQHPLATKVTAVVLLASTAVGLLGAYFHILRAALPEAAPGNVISVRLLVWGPPFLGPLMFAFVGLWGISAALIEDPPDSGRLRLFYRNWTLQLPLSKTRAYFLMFSLAALITTITAVLDHARTGFENDWLWIPTLIGVFSTFVGFGMALIEKPHRVDLTIYVLTTVLLVITGLVGAYLHIADNLTSRGIIVTERFIRGAPFLAPLLFANVGALGMFVLLDPRSKELKPSDADDA